MRPISLPLPEDLLDEVDRARGETARTKWIREAIELRLHPPAQIVDAVVSQLPTALANRYRPTRETVRPSECSHPPNQRIGNVCMVCDTKVGK